MKLILFFLLFFGLPVFCQTAEEFKQTGYIEICNYKQGEEIFDALYAEFDALIEFLQTNPTWAQKLYNVKERFIRSKDRDYYGTDFLGFYDESKRERRCQIAFYYSTHFHAFIRSRYPEFNEAPAITRFLDACLEIQKPYGALFEKTAAELGLRTIFSSQCGHPPILLKVVKYLPRYIATRPHYDGTVFSLFLDSTHDESLLLSPYKPFFKVTDFSSPKRNKNSMLLIPGTLLSEFSIYPTPHIVLQSGQIRYATVAFAMRPNYTHPKSDHAPLPTFPR